MELISFEKGHGLTRRHGLPDPDALGVRFRARRAVKRCLTTARRQGVGESQNVGRRRDRQRGLDAPPRPRQSPNRPAVPPARSGRRCRASRPQRDRGHGRAAADRQLVPTSRRSPGVSPTFDTSRRGLAPRCTEPPPAAALRRVRGGVGRRSREVRGRPCGQPLGTSVIRGHERRRALYEWKYPRALAFGSPTPAARRSERRAVARYLIRRPLLQAPRPGPRPRSSDHEIDGRRRLRGVPDRAARGRQLHDPGSAHSGHAPPRSPELHRARTCTTPSSAMPLPLDRLPNASARWR